MTTIATVAFQGSYDVDRNTESILALMREASIAGAELVVFPEICLQGYPPDFFKIHADRVLAAMNAAERVPDGPHVRVIADQARELGIHVVYGLTELGESAGVIYNTAVLTGPSGFMGKYRKVHVTAAEQLTWRKGHDWPVFETEIGRIGLLICYDKSWPESTRELMLRGAELFVMPSAWFTRPDDYHGEAENDHLFEKYRLLDRVRALENARWFVSSNYIGELGGGRFFGLSQIVDPLGRVVASTGTAQPSMAVATVDIRGGIKEANSLLGAFLIRDRRADTYLAASGKIPPAVDG